MNRLEQIKQRREELRTLLEDTTQVNLNLDEIETELRALEVEETELERRTAILNNVPAATPVPAPVAEQRAQGADVYDTVEYRNAFMQYVMNNTPIPTELRANENTLTTDIGPVIPPTVLNKIVQKMESVGMVLPLVTNTNFKSGLAIPTNNVMSVATWVSEGKGSDRQKATIGHVQFGHFKLQCRVSISLETSVMALSAFENMISNNVSKAMVKAIEDAIINGTGSGQPTGILKDATAGAKLDVKDIDFKTLVSAEAELPVEYEEGSVWVMTKKTFMAIAGMVDKNGQPIARVNYGMGGRPERSILGRGVLVVPYLKSFDAAAVGDVFAFIYRFEDYALNTNYQIGVKTYEDNETDDIVRKSTMICDGKPVDTNSLVKLAKKA
jgi:phage capsid family|nr:MAG TPA: major capsid protein [Caudoviricetes sp.]